jgi:hypothetical protein
LKRYRYIGANPSLTRGMTALGQSVDGVFKVQVDDICHPWAYGWHETPAEDWVEIEAEIEEAQT